MFLSQRQMGQNNRGNTVKLQMEPGGTIYPLYQRKSMLDSAAPKQKVDRHLPEKLLNNWK